MFSDVCSFDAAEKVRQTFIDFFKGKQHTEVQPSSSAAQHALVWQKLQHPSVTVRRVSEEAEQAVLQAALHLE